MEDKVYFLTISLTCFFLWCYGQEQQVRMTLLSKNHFKSEEDSEYQCHLSPPDNDPDEITVASLRTGETRTDDPPFSPDPPEAVYQSGDHPFYKVNMTNNGNSNDAFGVFGCNATKNGTKETIISTTRMRSDAEIVPSNGLFTQTVSISDRNVTISMMSTSRPVKGFRWRNNTNLWGSPNYGVDTFTIDEPIELYHAGIYECHRSGGRTDAKHGLNLLIVRACPSTTWGPPDCEGVCNSCYNGAVCDENTGQCVCAPGFQGENCSKACGGNRYGHTCEQRCTWDSDNEVHCNGTLFCLVHPFGCRCNTGFRGLDCKTECDNNTFGASCLQSCHCSSDECNRYTGECEGTNNTCDPRWTGEFCQECVNGHFGSECDQECHCSLDKCNRESGLCQSGGCLPQWADLFPPYSCQTGLESGTYTQVNPNVTIPVNCTAVQGPGGNLTGLDVVLSRSSDDLDEKDIFLNETFLTETTDTRFFTVWGVDQDVDLYCQLRNKSNVQVAVSTLHIDLYELPRLKTAPTEEAKTNISVTIRWLAWNENSDNGDPPVVGYIPYYTKKGDDDWIRESAVSTNESLEFTFNDLDSDTAYSFSVAAVREGEGGEGPKSPPLEVKTICAVPLNSPQNVTTNIAGEKQELVEISWKEPSNDDIGCTGGVLVFNIYYTSPTSNDEGLVVVNDSSATSYNISNLKVGEEYVFYMSLNTEGGESKKSNEARHLVPVLPDLSSPPTLINISSTTITISWEAWNETRNNGTPPVVSYNLYHKSSNDPEWKNAGTHNDIDGQYEYYATVKGLDPDTPYTISVAAVREGHGGEGRKSPPLEEQKTICDVPLHGPQDVLTNIKGEKQELVELSWKSPSDDEIRCSEGLLQFNIYYSSTSPTQGDESIVEVTDSSATSYIINNLEVGESYIFEMTLITEGGESSRSEGVQHLVPVLPSLKNNPTSGDFGCDTVTVTWNSWTEGDDDGTPPIIEYIPYYKLSSESDSEWAQGDAVDHPMNPTTLEYIFSDLSAEQRYDFAIAVVREGYGGEGEKNTYQEQTSQCDGTNVAAIVGSTVASVFFIVLVIFVIILWVRRDSKASVNDKKNPQSSVVNKAYNDGPVDSSTSSNSLPEDANEVAYANVQKPVPILLANLENYIKTAALEQEFLMFNSEPQFANEVGAKDVNKTKNRFKNMIAYDHSRIVLPKKHDDPHSDYYNANYIKNSKGDIGFIASQGPTKASLEDFWRMVWIKNVSNIVMLTNLVEKGKDRCFRYWPKSVGEITFFGAIKVKWQSTDQYANFEIRDYLIIFEDKTHRVRNWHYQTWPDKDIPDQPSPLIEFVRRIKMDGKQPTAPLLVHCSAGVGRTGTFIALCSLMEVVETSETIDVYGFVEQMRQDRINMVQTAKQYRFLHECLLEVYLAGDTAIPVDKLTTIDVKSQSEELSKEFKLLAKLDQMSKSLSSSATKEPEKCRFPDIIPAEKKRPYLQSQGKDSAGNYINACCVMSYRKDTAFIATQSPLPSTIEDFWRLVIDWKCPLIVMLNQLDEDDKTVCQYWPDEGSSQYGHITVELKEEQKENRYISRIFEVNHAHTEKVYSVHHLQLNSWDENNLWDIYTFIKDIEKRQQDFMMVEPTVIHCVNGVGRTGIVIAVKSEMERIEAEKKVDVFTTVRQLRASNHHLLQTEEQYTFCHQLLKLSSPDSTYANI